jgi:DNA polymerase-1
MKKLYLVDASAMFYRAFFALPPLTNSAGMQTNALYGFVAMTIKLLRDCKPDYIAYCFDRKEPSFRKEIYSEYKATRDEMPEALQPQIPYMRQLTDALGLFSIDLAGYEADDVIGSLAQFGRDHDLEVTIVSGDKDFAQLVGPCVTLYDTMKDTRLDSDGVMAKWGVRPDQIIDYLAIVGDTSDNIPGVKGVGPKGAVKLLSEYGTLDAIYENIEKVLPPGVRSKMLESKESAYMAKRLLKIVCDLKLESPLEKMQLQPIEQPKLAALLQELGFKNFERTLLQLDDAKKPGVGTNPGNAVVSAPPPVAKTPAKRSKSADLADWETDLAGLSSVIEPYSDLTAIWSDRGAIIAWQDKVIRCDAPPKEIGRVLAPKRLRWHGWELKEIFKTLQAPSEIAAWDSKLAAYVARPEKMGTFEDLYSQYCGDSLPPLASPAQIVSAQRELEKCLKQEIKDLNVEKVYQEFDLPLVSVLAKMEIKGIRIDTEELGRQSVVLTDDLRRLEKGIFEAAGGSFNIASPKQLGEILFEKMKLPPAKKTKTGFSTDSDVLQGLKEVHPIAALILEYRELAKLKSTYVDSLPALVNSQTKRVHTQLNQTLTTTGRLSSSNPNLQNIPIRTARGREIRKAFIADQGNVLISADYSQIELRVLAHMAGDQAMIAAFQDDLDIHTATASEIFSIGLAEVSSDQRRAAKAVNFGIAYGQGAFGLSEALSIPRREAAEIIERYFSRFPKIKGYMESTIRNAMEAGFVETLFGRRRYVIELKSQNPMIRRGGERAAINAPIQGTASDLVKLAMIRLNESLDIPILLQVHDELLFECPVAELEDNIAEIKKTMESVYTLSVPLKVNVGSGLNWEDAH